MRRLLAFAIAPALALALVTARPLSAQVSVGVDLGAYSAYVWRGLTFTSGPVLQPDLWLSVPIGGNASFTAGGWFNVEIGKYDNPQDDLSESGGTSSLNVAEFDWWGEFGTSVGNATITLGATGYRFPNDAGFTKVFNTIEVYAKVGLGTVLSPNFQAYYDVDNVKGLYLQGSVSHGLALSPSFTLTLGATAGLSAGQGCEPNSSMACTASGFNFFDNGLTHVDFSAGTSFSAGSVTISPVFHFQISSDEFTKIRTPTKLDESAKIWFGLAMNWASGGGDEAAE